MNGKHVSTEPLKNFPQKSGNQKHISKEREAMSYPTGRKRAKNPNRLTLHVFTHLFKIHLKQVVMAKGFNGVHPVSLKDLATRFCYSSPEQQKKYQFLKVSDEVNDKVPMYEYHRFCMELARMSKAGLLERPMHGFYQIAPKYFVPIAKKCKGNLKTIPGDFFHKMLEKMGL